MAFDVLSYAIGLQTGKGSGGSSGGGSGGGALEAGTYWKVNEPIVPMGISNQYLTFNNKLHALVKTSSSNDNYDLYEIADGEIKTVATALFFMYMNTPFEYNGKIHVVSGSNHYAWDGTSVKTLNKVAVGGTNLSPRNCFVGNGTVYAYISDYNNGLIAQWDEATDTWSNTGLVSETAAFGTAFYHNGEFYRLGNGARLYKASNGAWVEDKILRPDLAQSSSVSGIYIDGVIYYADLEDVLYKYDFATDVNLRVGQLPINSGSIYYYNCCGKLGLRSSSEARLLYILNEVT